MCKCSPPLFYLIPHSTSHSSPSLPFHQDLEAQLEEAYSEKSNLRSSQQFLEGRVEDLLDQLEEKKIESQERGEMLQELRRSMAEEKRKKEEVRRLLL